ncbi:MAG: hypothetical protein WAT19_08070 [Ferruginibacter sp.]
MHTSLPNALLSSLQNCTGFSNDNFIRVHENPEQLTSVRINPAKCTAAQLPFARQQAVPWCMHGFYLNDRPSFTIDPLFHAGAYYVQEASSMFLEQALRQTCSLKEKLTILDLCAAPGGKSTLLQSLVSAESLLVSNEVIKTRVNVLAENLTKWGAANAVVTNNDPKDFRKLAGFFDVIVVDAPCSGSGLFRKDAAAIKEWSLENVTLCSQRQQRILSDVLPALKEGGILIYSTCSYSQEEDEAIADWLVAQQEMESVSLHTAKEWGIVTSQSSTHKACGYRFYPDQLKGEGFYMAVFRKKQAVDYTEPAVKYKLLPAGRQEVEIVRPYVSDADAHVFIKFKDDILAFPAAQFENLQLLQSALYIKKAGVMLGVVIRNELVPHHELAVSNIVSNKYPFTELGKEAALDFLRKSPIESSSSRMGWSIVRYAGLPLGFIKILPNRINNYYPKEWRILNK